MLVSIRAVLDLVDIKKIAMGAFNVTSLEGIQAVLGAVEELGQPVILQFTPAHESVIPLRVVGPMMVVMVEKSSMPVYAYLDHGDKLEILQEALETGFASVMYDGSVLLFEENTANTKIAAEVVGNRGAFAEAETGAMERQKFSSMREDEEGEAMESYYTNPEQVWALTVLTGIDVLACLLGTIRGLYLIIPRLGFDRIHRIRESIGIPIVMYSESGVSDEDFRKCIANGIRKISYYIYLARTGGIYVKEKCADAGEYVFFRDVTQQVVQAAREDVLHTIKVFSHLE